MAENEGIAAQTTPQDGNQQPQGPQFALQRVYLKDSSFESPRSPAVFQGQWQPKINFDLKTRNTKVQDDVFEVVLVLTAEAELEEQPAFLVEVHQAGIFTLGGFEQEELERVMATICPAILFPYAREVIDSLVTKGSFPALMLAPINFEALYAQQKQAQAQQAAQAPEAAPAAAESGDAES